MQHKFSYFNFINNNFQKERVYVYCTSKKLKLIKSPTAALLAVENTSFLDKSI